MSDDTVYAAGGVVWRMHEGKLRVLLVHRTKYRDLTLPKGKVDPGELLPATAVREILEETGIRVTLGAPVGVSRYRLPSGRRKVVHYWAAEATDAEIKRSSFVPGREIAAIEWLSLKRARKALSYPVDVAMLDAFAELADHDALGTFPLVLLRHGKAIGRENWKRSDAERPLAPRGVLQAATAVGALAAFGPRRLVSSPALRCVSTIGPLAKALDRRVTTTALISQDAWEVGDADPRTVVGERVRERKGAVLCSHGPVLPSIMSEISLATGTMSGARLGNGSKLEPGAFSVVHLSRRHPGSGIVAVETHAPLER